MKSKLFTVRDQKVGTFAEPFPSPTAEHALRAMKSAVEQGQADVAKYPEDFDIYEVAAFDPETGVIHAYPQPKHISSALAFKPVAKTQHNENISL